MRYKTVLVQWATPAAAGVELNRLRTPVVMAAVAGDGGAESVKDTTAWSQ